MLLVVLALALAPAPDVTKLRSTVAGQGIADIQGLRASFVVDAAPDIVLATLWDIDRFLEIFPDILRLKVQKRALRQMDVAFTVDAVLAEVSYTLRRSLDREAKVIWWREIGGDLRHVRGSWMVKALPDGSSMVTYESFVEVGMMVPTGFYRDLALKKVTEMATRVRAAVKPR